jgi:hypothetical protein
MPFIIQGQAAKREPPAVPYIGEVPFDEEPGDLGDGGVNICPVEGCDAWGTDEPDCEHEYPGKCDACDTIVGDRYEELTWMGDAGWLCRRCNSRCEECDAEGVIAFCGVCALCLEVWGINEIGATTTIWPQRKPSLLLVLPGATKSGKEAWQRID